MKKLRVELIDLCNMLFLLTIIILNSCKDNPLSEKKINSEEKEVSLKKEDFLKCTNAKDTVFTNSDYIKFVQIDNEYYGVEIKMNEVIDTLNFSLDCKTNEGMVPKLLFRIEPDYICLGQGSSSYRYLTICSLGNKYKRIIVSKFETARNINSNSDGFVFKIKDTVFFYDLTKRTLLFKKISNVFIESKIKSSELHEDKIIMVLSKDSSLIYSLKDFQKKKLN